MTRTTLPTFVVGPPSQLAITDDVYIDAQLRAIQETLKGISNALPQPAVKVPPVLQPWMIRRALSPWRPVAGQTVDRWVYFDGSAWQYLNGST